MISTAIRAATSLRHECRAMIDAYDRTESVKRYSRRNAAIEAAAASLGRRALGDSIGNHGGDRALVVNWYTRTRRATKRAAKETGKSSATSGKATETTPEEAGMGCPREATKVCLECGTSVTPMWRPGPKGPKSLCNACGIKYRRAKTRPTAGGGGKMITVPISAAFPDGQLASMSSPLEVVNTEELNKSRARDQRRTLLLVWEGQKQRRKKRPARRHASAAAIQSQCSKEEADAALLLMSLSSSAAASALLIHS